MPGTVESGRAVWRRQQTVRHPRRKRKRRPAPVSAGWSVRFAVLALLGVLVLGVPEAFGASALGARGPLLDAITGLLLDAGFLAALAILYRRRPFTAAALGVRRAAPGPSVGWVFLSCAIIAAINYLWLQRFLGQPAGASLGVTLTGSPVTLGLTGLFLCLLAPVTEEIFFRGLLYRALRNRLSVVPAVVIAGTIFAAVHGLSYPIDTLPPRLGFGILACLLYERTGSLLPGIALHIFIDAGGFELAATGNDPIVLAVFVLAGIALLVRAAATHPRDVRGPRPSASGAH